MEYSELLKGLPYTGTPPAGEAAAITQDSRGLTPGCVFVCVKGRGADGHAFAQKALNAGAGMVVTQRPLGLPREVTVPDTREAFAGISQAFFGRPAKKLTLVGVTGTNGKTTVASVLKQTLIGLGVPCALMGTIQTEIGGAVIPAKFTTPDAFDTAALMARAVKAGCTHLVMEASSQALAQKRLFGLFFALGIFTNLTQDHLDYHGDMQRYYEAKKLLFAQCGAMLANVDDTAGRRLLDEADTPVRRGYSTQKNDADFSAKGVVLGQSGVRFAFLGDGFLCPVRFAIPGTYSVENALAAGAAAVMLGHDPRQAAQALGAVAGVRGRCEVLYAGDVTVICDFAHTPDAVEKLLASLKPFAAGRLVVLFGNAGSRDAAKRPAISVAALRYSNAIFVTADNPREEDVMKTIEDCLPPLKAGRVPYTVQPDREKAVCLALNSLLPGDVLVLCGKGHEDYQVMDGKTLFLNERMIVEDWAAQRKENQ